MKKIFTFMMIFILASLLIFITACGQETTDPDESNQREEQEENEENEEQADPAEQEEPISDDKSVDETNLSPTPGEKQEAHQVVLYFSDNDLMDTFRIKEEVVVGKEEDVAKAALEAWIDGPKHEELSGLFNSKVIIEYVEKVDGIVHVSFSKEVQEINLGSSGELMFAEQIAMIMQQFGFDRTQILVEGRIGETLLGHLYTGEPIVANDPESYQWVDEKDSREIVLQNVAFRIYEPTPGTEVKDRVVVRGLARVYEGTILYEFEDGHFILDEGFTTATEGAPGWGEFEIIIEFDDVANYSGRVILFEESAKDGSRINELQIPIKVTK
jgi:hypothetical protein